MVQTLPTLLDRLRSLKQLHQEAASFSDSVQQISSEQALISGSLKSQEQLLETVRHSCVLDPICLGFTLKFSLLLFPFPLQVEANFAKNNAAIESNIDSLDKRMSALLSKVEGLKK